MPLDTAILSPEKTVLTYRLAGLGSRLIAHLLDFLFIGAFLYFITLLLALLAGVGPDSGSAISGLLGFIFSLFPFAYFILFEGLWNGQTPGKKIGNVRVRMADGTPVTFQASVGRNLLRVADFLPFCYFVGTVAMFLNPKLQRLGDLVAGTIVTHEGKVSSNFSIAPHRVGIHPLEHLVGEIRNMTDAQYYVLRRYCDRFPQLPVEVQNHLTETVWLPLSRNLGVNIPENVHPIYIAEATVMKYGRIRGLL